MYVQVAHYRLGTGTAENLRERVEQGPVRVMQETRVSSSITRSTPAAASWAP
jgi:hypothetical protein